MSFKSGSGLTSASSKTEATVSVIAEAFHDYPVMRFVLGSPDDYDEQLRTLIHFFVMARVHRDEVMLGIDGDGGLAAAATAPVRRRPPPRTARRARWSYFKSRLRLNGRGCRTTINVSMP